MQGTRKQHTVAQSYLKRFTADGTHIFAFNKPDGKVFNSNVVNVAQDAFFYDLPAEVMIKSAEAGGPKIQLMEKLLAAADNYAKKTIDDVLEEVKSRPISKDHRVALSTLMTLQFSRTPLNRQLLREGFEKGGLAIVKEMLHKRFPDEAKHCEIGVEFDEESWVSTQVSQILDEDHMVKLAAAMQSLIWLFGVNRTIQPFYTSDHPIVRNAHCSSRGIPLTGFLAPGIEIAYPLSSKCILYMLDPRMFRKLAIMDGRLMLLDPHDIEHFNSLQVRRSFRQVYCEKDEFDQARGVCRKYPECCNPNRSRVEIVNTENHLVMFIRE